jgi:hypothetical protein
VPQRGGVFQAGFANVNGASNESAGPINWSSAPLSLNRPGALLSAKSNASIFAGTGRTSLLAPSATLTPAVDSHPSAVPALDSNPGAPYTVYLDFAGFNFTGVWGGSNSGSSSYPGSTPAYENVTTSFSAAQQANIAQMWARIAEKYSPFGVNVTTVDPAVAAGANGSDAARQAYYDQTAQLMHTVIGGSGSWSGGGGVSYVGVTQYSTYNYDPTTNNGAGPGYHTNFVFSDAMQNNNQYIAEDSSHENGHGLGLQHQSDYNGSTLVNEYSSNGGATGVGSYAPIMGVSYYAQRGLWRSGNADQGDPNGPTPQNDPQVIFANQNMTITSDGIGQTRLTATLLPVAGSNIDYTQAKGVIVPADQANPNPIGVSNYTSDYFSFSSTGGNMNVTLYDSAERLTPGTPDPGGTLSSTLTLLDSDGNVITTVGTNYSTMSENITRSIPAGLFYLQVASTGGEIPATDSTNPQYYDMGDFFMTGFVPAPEPTSLMLTSFAASFLLLRRRRSGRTADKTSISVQYRAP